MEPTAFDGEPHLVRPREAIDRRRPGEVARVPPADLVDEQERRADRPVRPPVGDGEANRRDRLPLVLGGRRRHRHRNGFEPDAREPPLVHHPGDLPRVEPGGADLLERPVGAPALGQVSALEVDRPGVARQRGQGAEVGRGVHPRAARSGRTTASAASSPPARR